MALFIRYINEEAHADSDLERGYSFAGSLLYASEHAAETTAAAMGYSGYAIREMDHDALGVRYGIALPGLCGFRFVGTWQDAIAKATAEGGYGVLEYGFAAVYEGEYIGQADCDDGDVFTPLDIVAVADLRH